MKTTDCKCAVLVVEDDKDVRESLEEALLLEGYNVHTAGDGQQALHLLQECCNASPPCVILLDLMMPVMNGWEFLKTLRTSDHKNLSNIPVVVLSAANRQWGMTSLQQGADAFLSKPVELNEIFTKVAHFCKNAA